MQKTFFIAGTDTGVGKTLLTALLAQFLQAQGASVAALKPICSGGRADARKLHAALGGTLSLADINPWFFRAAIAPVLAARRENRAVTLAQVVAQIRPLQQRSAVTLVEGAGGLLSPLGEQFDSRDLLLALRAKPIIVAANQLGVLNHLRLTLAALPKAARGHTKIVLMSPLKSGAARATNATLLGEFFPAEKIFTLPWLGKTFSPAEILKKPAIRRTLAALLAD